MRWCLHTLLLLYTTVSCRGDLPPSFTSDLSPPLVPEDTAVGAAVLTLRASDPENSRVTFGLQGSDSLRVNPNTGVITVVKALDRESKDTLRIVVSAEDSVQGGDNNVVRVPLDLVVLDVNDNAPVFSRNNFDALVPEDAPSGYVVVESILLSDVDQVGDVLDVKCIDNETGDPCSTFEIASKVKTSRQFEGSLILRDKLSYQKRDVYHLELVAMDGVNVVAVPLTVKVQDVQDSPPVFSGSTTGIVSEDATIGTLVMTIDAKDGDMGDPRKVMFDLVENPLDFFLLDPESGELRTAKPLDREAVANAAGLIRLKVRAYETVDGSPVRESKAFAMTDISVTIKDVNDEPPTFNRREYRVSVPENLPPGTPVPDLDMIVRDTDVGSNSIFSVRLADTSGRFSIEPGAATGSSSLSLRLSKGSLDYENPNERKFILLVVAEETRTSPRLSSTATILLSITDTNDNPPSFAQEAYTSLISETAAPGSVVASISASDRDTGDFGTAGIRYKLFGNGAERFTVDPESGTITVSACDTPGRGNCLNYEERPTYFLSLDATDDLGTGHSSVVPLRISLKDANDNPPRFSQEVYRAVIMEGAKDFDPPLVVVANDPDKSSIVEYSIVGGDQIELFVIDKNTGRIRVRNQEGLHISEMKQNEITLVVEAKDGVGSHAAKVRISVQDINNNSPIFSEKIYLTKVEENAPIGTTLDRVAASDDDIGRNAEIHFQLMSGSYDDFAIDLTSGEVSIARSLNFDSKPFYSMLIVATDHGIPSLSSSVLMNVSVIDNNDKNPYFVPTKQRVKVNEDTETGVVFYHLTAADKDVSHPDGLQFHLTSVFSAINKEGVALDEAEMRQLLKLFNISPNGNVSLNIQLNRNITTEITLSVTVTDITARPPQTSSGYLVITIVDVNDHPPTFPPPWTTQIPIVRTTVLEELPIGSVVTSMSASDLDSNIESYVFDPPSELLRIDKASGVVTVRGRLDYEEREELSEVVIVRDTGVPQLSATATLIVNLENINDEEPVFDKLIYDGSVAEHSSPGTSVLRVHAVDRDRDHLGTVTYSLAGDHNQFFKIDSTGLITVNAGPDLDREMFSTLRFRAVAIDSGPKDTRRQTSVPVHVNIMDINDHAPKFVSPLFKASIVEKLPLNPPVRILQTKAIDKDDGINSALYYTIVRGNEDGYFRLDPSTGILYPNKQLLAPYNETHYDLMVQVRDMNGTGETTDSARVEVIVLPQNEHKPFFVVPARPDMDFYVRENSTEAEMTVLTVSATDRDRGDNGRVQYHFRVNDLNVQETEEFVIDAESGVVTTKHIMDREEREKYELVLVAKDQGSPISYESLRVVQILLKDIEDNLPAFPDEASQRTYTFMVTENLPKDKLIGQVEAQDADSGANARIFYFIFSGNVNSNFYIDKSNGNIFTNNILDREERREYNLLIKATNNPNWVFHKEEVSDKDRTVAYVRINIKDENDTPPKFGRKVYYAGVPHTAEVDRLVRMVTAQDGDAGRNGTIHYSIRSSTFYRPGEATPVGSIVPSPFNMSSTGELLTATLMSAYRRHRFLLKIEAKEVAPPYRIDTCTVNIWVWERDELIKIVFAERPESVVANQEEIASTLSTVLEGTAVVDEIRYFTHDNDSISGDWTEMLVHVVNKTSQIVPTAEVLERVDRAYPMLMKAQPTEKIRKIYPALLIEEQSEIDARMAGLIALVIALFIGFISFIAVCCCLRFWVMTPAKSQEHLIHRNLDDDIGVNTTENPLWMEQKLKTYEEQELSMQVMSEFDTMVNNLPGLAINGSPNGNNLDAQSNTYATIQKSHGGTIRSLQLKNLQRGLNPGHPGNAFDLDNHSLGGQITLGEEPGESNDYATLEHLRRSQGPSASRGPRVPGVETPLAKVFGHEREVTPDMQELATSFTGSTFQPPERNDPNSSMANRPLPEEPSEGRRLSNHHLDEYTHFGSTDSPDGVEPIDNRRQLTLNAQGEPCLVAELL